MRKETPALPDELPGSPGSSPYRTALPVRSAVPALTRVTLVPVAGRVSRSDSGPGDGDQQQQPCAGYGCGSKKGTSMSFKSKMLAAAATLALVGGVGTAGARVSARQRGHPVVWSPAASTCSAETFSDVLTTKPGLRRSTCSGRARRSASRSSCSRRATPTRRWTSPISLQGNASTTSSRLAWCPPRVTLHYGGGDDRVRG